MFSAPVQHLVASGAQFQQSDAVIENHGKFSIIKGSLQYQDKLYVVGHSVGGEWLHPFPEEHPEAPADDATHFDAPARVLFYCEDGQPLLLTTGRVIAGVDPMPPVVETVEPAGGRIPNAWLANPWFEVENRPGNASPGESIDLIRRAIEYNRNVDFDVLVIRTEELVRTQDVFQALASIHPYNEIHWLSCRGW